RSSAQALGVSASWTKSRRPLNLADDFLFELYILFELILDLQNKYNITYIPGQGTKKHQFPLKPANKEGRPRFEVHTKSDGRLLWQICAGTRIRDIHDVDRTPDISFQNADSSETPSYHDVRLIWDAKYKKNPSHNITHADVSGFGRWLEILNLRNADKPEIVFLKLAQLLANNLITNGLGSNEPEAELTRLDMKEVTSFHPNSSFEVRP
ncbi:hypothetical protein ACFLVS_06375, partial [Chloroflexota bacterium]